MTKLSNSQIIQKYLEAGHCVQLTGKKSGDVSDVAVYYTGEIRQSILMCYGREFGCYTIDNMEFESITPIPRKPPVYPVGTRVRVFGKDEIHVIDRVHNNHQEGISYEVHRVGQTTPWHYPHYDIYPYIEEEEEKMVRIYNDGGKFTDYKISVVRKALEEAEGRAK